MMKHFTVSALFAALAFGGLSSPAHAQSADVKAASAEFERQMRAMLAEGRKDDIKIISDNRDEVVEQIKAGYLDLDAILAAHAPASSRTSDTRPSAPVVSTAPAQPVPMARIQPANVPKDKTPIATYMVTSTGIVSHMPVTYGVKLHFWNHFPSGYSIQCSDFDPRFVTPTPAGMAKVDEDCEVIKGLPEKGVKKNGFKRGETIDIAFGNVSSLGIDNYGGGATRTSALISTGTLRMTKEGRIEIGRFNMSQMSSAAVTTSSRSKRTALRGRYALDGNLITIETDEGETHVGFINWSSNTGSKTIDHIHINGTHYWDRRK